MAIMVPDLGGAWGGETEGPTTQTASRDAATIRLAPLPGGYGEIHRRVGGRGKKVSLHGGISTGCAH